MDSNPVVDVVVDPQAFADRRIAFHAAPRSDPGAVLRAARRWSDSVSTPEEMTEFCKEIDHLTRTGQTRLWPV